MAINTSSVQYNGGLLPTVGKSITPKLPILLLLSFFFNVCLVLLLKAEVCKLTRCSSTGYQYSELLFLSCLFSGQLKLHDGSSSCRG